MTRKFHTRCLPAMRVVHYESPEKVNPRMAQRWKARKNETNVCYSQNVCEVQKCEAHKIYEIKVSRVCVCVRIRFPQWFICAANAHYGLRMDDAMK